MKIEGQHTFDVPQESLWEALLDPEILSKTLPGCEELTEVDDNDYKGTMHIGIGPVQGRFEGQFSILDMDPPENYQLKLEGKGPTGFLQGKGEIRLEIDGQSIPDPFMKVNYPFRRVCAEIRRFITYV